MLNPENCLTCTVYVHRRTVGASLADSEINKEMSELLDNQVDTQNENLKINSPGSCNLSYRGCDENTELEEKNDCRLNFCDERL